MLKLIVISSFLFSSCLFAGGVAQEDTEVKIERAFLTDGCTGWIDGTRKYDWSHCCEKHDLQMWAGGSKENRKKADKELKACIKEASNGFHAWVMGAGVFIGGLSPIKIESKKWGNAWGKNAGYFELTPEQIIDLENSLFSDQTHYSNEEVLEFIEELKELNSLDKNNQ